MTPDDRTLFQLMLRALAEDLSNWSEEELRLVGKLSISFENGKVVINKSVRTEKPLEYIRLDTNIDELRVNDMKEELKDDDSR